MKKFGVFFVIGLCVLGLIGCSCGVSATVVQDAGRCYEEFKALYDEVAPIVAQLDDASVTVYTEATKVFVKASNAYDAKFEGYDEKALTELMNAMNTTMVSLSALKGKQPIKEVPNAENGNVYTVTIYNQTGTVFESMTLKSGSGSYDIPVAISGSFVPESSIAVTVQAPENEKFSVCTVDTEGKAVSFTGDFYMISAQTVTLTQAEEQYLVVLNQAPSADTTKSEEKAE